jgi:2OG-Fe dioxygenase
VELHQFRIEATAGQIGEPTPEGLHRDGVDWVLVALVNRTNVESGVTSIYGMDHRHLGDFTLTDPLDAVFLRDNRVFHGVTTIRALEPSQPRVAMSRSSPFAKRRGACRARFEARRCKRLRRQRPSLADIRQKRHAASRRRGFAARSSLNGGTVAAAPIAPSRCLAHIGERGLSSSKDGSFSSRWDIHRGCCGNCPA